MLKFDYSRSKITRTAWPATFFNGRWWDGERFKSETVSVVDGKLTRKRPTGDFATTDLAGAFVVPPAGDAHCHHFDSLRNVDDICAMYKKDGVFYAQSLGNLWSGAKEVAAAKRINGPGNVDVEFTPVCLTSTLGHPFLVYESLALGIYKFPMTEEQIESTRNSRRREGDVYLFAETPAMLDSAWRRFEKKPGAILKILLLESNRYDEKKQTARPGDNGLPPEIVPEIVKRARAEKMRVFAHVENAFDFGVCARAGVDGFAHMPGYSQGDKPGADYLLAESDVRAFGRRKGVVIPTAWIAVGYSNPKTLPGVQETQRRNIALLKRHGARFAIGSDSYGTGPWPEVEYLRDLGVFDDRELLNLFTRDTPQLIFPGRKIGTLGDGAEASFLAVDADPSKDVRNLKKIRLRVKGG